MKNVLASNNAGKILEIETLLREFNISVIPQKEYGVTEIPETGLTFVENALLKARHACRETGLPAIADDSGLAVNILKGAPGIYSARYAGPQACSADNIEKLLYELKNIPDENRQASFHYTKNRISHRGQALRMLYQKICNYSRRSRSLVLRPLWEKMARSAR